ncbi:MAG TPA: GGDEF domain-containing protein [Pseudolabrys sp.]|nr:GGDEF domain-containing protein [Pseudolabrys sp.]
MSAGHADDHERTMTFAEIALGQIKALSQPAFPRNYEIWYTYATGYNPALNQRVNEILKKNGALTEDDLNQLFENYLSPSRLTERIDKVGSQVMGEIDQVMAMIDAAAGSASSYTESLADMSEKIVQSKDREGLRAIVESLVQTTKEMEESNQKLEARLNASKQEIRDLQQNLEAVRTESLTDPLTQLSNRKLFDSAIAQAIADAQTREEPLSLLMTDIDHFKAFNDNYGHLTGDQVLRLVAMSLKQNVKGRDTAARYGGEEFGVVLPNTPLRAAITVADQIRCAVMTKELMKRSTGEHLGRVTVSVGVATLRKSDTVQSLIERTDACLYAAKRHGRNRVMSETDPEVVQAEAAKVA